MGIGDRSALSREKLLDSVRRVILEHGIEGLRIRRIAAAAGVSPGLVLYHYPDQTSMMLMVHRDLVSDYFALRESSVLQESDAPRQLLACAKAGLPPSVSPELISPLFELHGLARRSEEHSKLMTELWERELALYAEIITDGVETGKFTPTRPVRDIAASILSMEDGLALHLIGKNGSMRSDWALASLLHVASLELGCPELRDL